MKVTRRSFTAGAAGTVATFGILRQARAAISYKMASNLPAGHPMLTRIQAAIDMFKAFGAAPQSISFGEVYTALQTKLVEAQENPLSLVETAKFYEVQKYASMTNHMWDGFWILANRASWGKLPKPVQEAVDKRLN